ncbi:hypothetical protein [Xanthomonas sacchari]|uniref:hypothetical protein n=1 Tax=Xanthomonas sacchari TaxID=56458 RepID=UPI003B21551C
MHRTKASLIHRRAKNPRAVKIQLGRTTLESIESYLGVEVENASKIAKQTEAQQAQPFA